MDIDSFAHPITMYMMLTTPTAQGCCPSARAFRRCRAEAAAGSGGQTQEGSTAQVWAVSRRQLLSAAAAAGASVAGASPAAAADLTPYQRGLALEYGLTNEGRIPSCPTDANPNCVGTSNPGNSAYMPAWEAPQGSLADAMLDFTAALLAVAPEARLVASSSGPGSEYRRFVVDDKLFDHDDIEVLISLQKAPYEKDPPLVTFRSMAARVRYIWPIIQPITDFGAQRQRLKQVRQRLGWRLVGCDLLECYEE